MTFVVAPSRPRGGATAGLRLETLMRPLALVVMAALWALCHPYSGINGDVNLYIGRVVANLDPTGVGRDLLFVNDGQSKFSLFPLLAGPLVATFGVTVAAAIIALAASTCWFVALLALARSLTSGRPFWIVVTALCVLPVTYGYPGIFSFAETSALPRPFAEAAVIGALAAMTSHRPVVAVGLLLAGMALHPLMTLPGVGVALIVALSRSPRPARVLALAACGVSILFGVTLGWFGFPLFDRLFVVVDPVWFGMLMERSPHLFVTHWTAAAVPPILAQTGAILVALRTAPASQRQVFIATLVVAVAGLAGAAVLADEAHVLLALQVQTWRVTWLLAVIGGSALAVGAPRLWTRDNHGRLVLALLALPWFVQTDPLVALALTTAAVGLEYARSATSSAWATDRVVLCAYVAFGALAVQSFVGVLLGYVDYLPDYPAALPHLIDPLRNNLEMLPVLALTLVWLAKTPRVGAVSVAVLGFAATLLAGATVAGWDQTQPDAAMFESPAEPPGFAAMSAGRPQEVLWLDGRGEPWFMLDRPQYVSQQQGVSMVFSRPLAVEWHRRAQRLMDLGLAETAFFRPGEPAQANDRVHVTQAGIDTLCRDPDAPGLIFLPVYDEDAPPVLRDMAVWTLAKPRYHFDVRKPVGSWRIIKRFAIVPCHRRSAAAPHA